MVSPSQRRRAVEMLQRRLGVSQRRACEIVGQHRFRQRYRPGGDRPVTGTCAPSWVSSPETIPGGGIGGHMRCCCVGGGWLTARKSSVCGARRAFGYLPSGANADARATPTLTWVCSKPSTQIVCGRWTSGSMSPPRAAASRSARCSTSSPASPSPTSSITTSTRTPPLPV